MKFQNLIKQAQEFQKKMKKMQEELEKKVVESTSGGGMITVTANGRQEILSIKIEPEVVNSDDVEMLEDLILAAVNEAKRKSEKLAQEEMKKITGGLNIPGLGNLNIPV
ncbi:MAG: YbaB/EbfC family nucleoid-associated protein [Candidatus Cloacimonadota bacterium]|nr:MAG: YbaB/EbfC family nucleoid-associated protein [Candidatus Cloacimonadota bacterium]